MREEGPDPKVEQAAGSGARISRRGGQASNRRQAGTKDDPGVSHEGADHQLELGLLSCARCPAQLGENWPHGGHRVRVEEEFCS